MNIIIFISIMMLTLCENIYTNSYNTVDNNETEYKNTESKININKTDISEITSEQISIDNNSEQLIQLPDKYRRFIETEGIKDEIKYYKIDDIDLDGNNEILIVTKDALNIVVLRETNGDIFKITNNITEFSYSTYPPYDADIIEMDNSNKKYIIVKLKNAFDRPIGFEIFDLNGNKFDLFCYSASGTSVGYDEIIDSDNNGKYDGYIQQRDGYDYYNYDVVNYYIWNGNEFIYDHMDINNIPDYPKNVEDVAIQYLMLYSIYDEKNENIKNRLKELCNNNLSYVSNYILNKDEVHKAVYFIDKSLCFDVEFFIDEQDKSQCANFYVDNLQEGLEDFKYSFILKKINDKWTIIKIIHKD